MSSLPVVCVGLAAADTIVSLPSWPQPAEMVDRVPCPWTEAIPPA